MERKRQINIRFRWGRYSLLIISLLTTNVSSVEEDQPAIFLSPRNFNPHPYEASYDPRDSGGANRLGPVLFPPTPDEDNSVNNNIVTLGREPDINHPIDNHPYAKVARKHKYKFPGRFNQEHNKVNPRIYEGLAKHATRVLSEPPSQLGKDYTLSSLSNHKKNYAFSYKVLDHLTGDDFSHTQSQNSRATNGEYRVKLPDGRVQIVSYIADKNGYKADVKYTENDLSSPNIQIQHIPPRNKIRPISILKTNSYDYQSDHVSGSHFPEYDGKSVLYTPLQQHQDYNNAYITATPNPAILNTLHFSTPQPKVEIYTNNHGQTRFIASTIAPYLFQNAKEYHQNVVSSTIAPSLVEYNHVYVNTPKFTIVGNQQHEELVYGKK